MRKIVKISGKDYSMKSSAFTQFKYKDITGRKMLSDLQEITKLQDAEENELLGGIEDLTEIILKMAYVMIDEADSKQVPNYEEFLKEIESLYDDVEWINDVVELASSPLSRGIQTTPQQIIE